jgi:hypothetical protein
MRMERLTTGDFISAPPTPLRTAALKQKPAPELKMFHAIMLVTREWRVEAETAEEAHELLAAGHGHRCHLGDRVYLEVHRVED